MDLKSNQGPPNYPSLCMFKYDKKEPLLSIDIIIQGHKTEGPDPLPLSTDIADQKGYSNNCKVRMC